MTDTELRSEGSRLQSEYTSARAENDWQKVADVEPRMNAVLEEERLRHFARMGWTPSGWRKRDWNKWKDERGL